MSGEYRHDLLVERAERWLRGAGCNPVFTEPCCWATSERPDAFGISSSCTWVVECKTSVGDFYSDRSKPFRKSPELGMGKLRYFMVPEGLVKPELVGTWGLLYVRGNKLGRVEVVKPSEKHSENGEAECLMLRSRWLWTKQKGASTWEEPIEGDYAI